LALAASTALALAVIYALAVARPDGVDVVASLFAISILLWTPAIVALLLAERSGNPVVATILMRCDRIAASALALVRGRDPDA
jgi:hypothetical protein